MNQNYTNVLVRRWKNVADIMKVSHVFTCDADVLIAKVGVGLFH
jgi:hypothetical protein